MTRPLKNPLYDNIVTLAPTGEQICRCNHEKAQWYLQNGLAATISDDPLIIQLNFEPKGIGHFGDKFYLEEKLNICVSCGSTEHHTRHHIVPYCFRRYFPEKYKTHNSHDIVILCVACHDEYEVYADELKNDLSIEFEIPFLGKGSFLPKDLFIVKRHASALKRSSKMPPERVEKLYTTLRKHYSKEEITEEDILKAASIKPICTSQDSAKFGQRVIEKITDLQAFVERWRQHFVDVMHPKYMPKHWQVDRKLLKEG